MCETNPILIQIRSKLQEKSIKLWLEPYYKKTPDLNSGPVESELQRLAREFSREIGINEIDCLVTLKELQSVAINKLIAKEEFQNTGIATLKVKVVRPRELSNFEIIKCPLSENGNELQQRLSEKIRVNFNKIKIIASGKVLHLERSLNDQNICNNQQIMALIETEKENENSLIYDRARKAKEDAELIIESQHQGFFEMEDQDGNAVYLPPGERKAITIALALYEKGRAAMKRERYAEALILFLDADERFSSCSSSFLNSVDNYALLNLDIVWCYLCLKSFDQLKDADRRLKICEKNFQRSYGNDMDRVMALKGNSQNERALMMRLHLLQAILLFHQNKRNESYQKLLLAEDEIKSLKIDDNSFGTLLEMGYDAVESRIALRSCNNNVEQAINFIIDRRNKKLEARRQNVKEKKLLQNTKVKDGRWVNLRSLQTLVDMGFDNESASVALKMTDNNIGSAVDLLHNNQEAVINEMQKLSNDNAQNSDMNINDSLIQQLTSLGFDPEMARIALQSVFNNPEQAVDILRKLQSDGSYDSLLNAMNDLTNQQINRNSNEAGPSTDSMNANKQKKINDLISKKIDELNTVQAYQRFSEDMAKEEDDYLDLPLVQEEQILTEYKSLLEQ